MLSPQWLLDFAYVFAWVIAIWFAIQYGIIPWVQLITKIVKNKKERS